MNRTSTHPTNRTTMGRCSRVLGLLAVLAILAAVWAPPAGASLQNAGGATIPMTGGDAARTGQQPGPAPAGEPAELWATPLGEEGPEGRGGLFSQPLVADGVVYVVGANVPDEDGPIGDDPNGFVYAVEAETGDLLWQVPAIGVGSFSPALVDGVLYTAVLAEVDGELMIQLVAVSVESEGEEELWRADLEVFDRTQDPPALTVEDGVLYAVAATGAVHAFDAESGDALWDTEGAVRSRAEPAVSDGVVVVADYEGVVHALESDSGEEIWAFEAGGTLGGPAVADGMAYVGDTKGAFYAIDEEGELAWQLETGAAYSAVGIAGGMAFLCANEGGIVAVSLEDEEVAWTAEAPEPGRDADVVARRLAIVDDVIVAATGIGEVFGLSAEDGEELWRADAGARLYSPPSVIDGVVYVPDGDGTLHAFGEGGAPSDDRPSDDEDKGSDKPRGGDETYESPQYGYALTYDPAAWSVSTEDADPDDAYDQVSLEHELGFVGLVGDPDYDEDSLVDCVDDYQAGLEQGDGVSRVRAMRGEAGEEDGRAWAAVSYELDTGEDEPLEAARYIECRQLDGVTLVILQTSLEADYDDFSASREELLDGLEEA